ncbi:hypothetical protein TSAR_005629 [Trichomalopsis sarcophagae]|uniref:Uncharacterized protein n=1 Tax=Trichomalopsis sarcophagae TaxID=543379 RepID=A0A232F3K7_9HYME|nr:hypothetical protein TSAR_005629 [Trichomalopsis sarcophagae]
MSNVCSNVDHKCLLCFLIIVVILVNLSTGAIIRASSHEDPDKMFEDMKVVESEKVPEFSRKDLMEIIQKSQFFQDIFSEQPDPMTIQFGHVCENPNEWEQRFEQRDFNKNHHQGKMRWGNKNGDYGEHYWDLGHAG